MYVSKDLKPNYNARNSVCISVQDFLIEYKVHQNSHEIIFTVVFAAMIKYLSNFEKKTSRRVLLQVSHA